MCTSVLHNCWKCKELDHSCFPEMTGHEAAPRGTDACHKNDRSFGSREGKCVWKESVCLCVCVRERERERVCVRERKR